MADIRDNKLYLKLTHSEKRYLDKALKYQRDKGRRFEANRFLKFDGVFNEEQLNFIRARIKELER